MLYQVKSGRRNLSTRGLYRLQELEALAGISRPDTEAAVSAISAFPAHDPTGIPVEKRRQIVKAIKALEAAVQALKEVVGEKN